MVIEDVNTKDVRQLDKKSRESTKKHKIDLLSRRLKVQIRTFISSQQQHVRHQTRSMKNRARLPRCIRNHWVWSNWNNKKEMRQSTRSKKDKTNINTNKRHKRHVQWRDSIQPNTTLTSWHATPSPGWLAKTNINNIQRRSKILRPIQSKIPQILCRRLNKKSKIACKLLVKQ
jgi:hypothetical protein